MIPRLLKNNILPENLKPAGRYSVANKSLLGLAWHHTEYIVWVVGESLALTGRENYLVSFLPQ